jgi:SnoaL-like protein
VEDMRLSAAERIELVTRHVDCELRQDWDGCLATMIEDPFYVHYPAGVRVTGREAVVAQWKLLVGTSQITDAIESANLRTWAAGNEIVTLFEWTTDEGNGNKHRSSSYALFTFEGGLISGETIFADGQTGDAIISALGGDFFELPGVDHLEEVGTHV